MPRLFLKLFRRRSMERDVEAELAFHRDMAAAHGSPIPMGNTTVVQEQARDLWRFAWIENLWRDVVYGTRSLRRSPALVVAALLSLGLGIGINTGIFSMAVEFLLSEPSITDARSVVSVKMGGNSHSKKEVVEFVRSSGLFQDVVGENEEVTGEAVTGDSLRLAEDLKLDSLGRVQLQSALEQRFDVELEEDAMAAVETVGELRRMVEEGVVGGQLAEVGSKAVDGGRGAEGKEGRPQGLKPADFGVSIGTAAVPLSKTGSAAGLEA